MLRAIGYLGLFAAVAFLIVLYSVPFREDQYRLVHVHQILLYLVIVFCTITLTLMRRGNVRFGGTLQIVSLWLSLSIVPDLMGVPLHVVAANHFALAICIGPLMGWMGALTMGVGSLIFVLIQDSPLALGLGITPLLVLTPLQIYIIEIALYGMVLPITEPIVFLSQRRFEISQVTDEALEVASYSEKNLETIIESMADVLLVVDVRGMINKANRAAFTLLGYTEGELSGKPLRTLLLDIAENATGVESMSRHQAMRHVSKRLKTKDGRIFPVSLSSAIMTDSFGQPSGLILVAQDMTELENMRMKLHQSNVRFNQAIAFSRLGVFEYDMESGEFMIEDTVRQTMKAIGMDKLESFSQFLKYVLPEDHEKISAALNDYRADVKSNVDVEFRVNTVQGERWIMVRGALQAGSGPRLIGTFMDVTRRKRAELELALRDNVLRAVTASSEAFLRTSDWESQIPAMMRDLGQAAQVSRVYLFRNETSADGRKLWSQKNEWAAPGIKAEIDNPELQGFDYTQNGMAAWAEKLHNRQPAYGIVSALESPSREIYERQSIKSIAMTPVFVQDEWWGMIGFDDCLKERAWSEPELDALQLAADSLGAAIHRQRVERDLRENRDFLMSIMDNLGQGVTVVDEDGDLMFVNAAAAALIGVTADKLVGRKPYEFIDTEQVEEMQDQREIRRKGLSTSYPMRVHHVDGHVTDVIVSAVPRYVDGKIEGSYAVLTNITEQRLIEENRMQLSVEREQMRIMSDFVRDASHDFRTPLSIIQTSLYLLKRKAETQEQLDRLGTIGMQASRLSRLIDGLLTMLELDKASLSLIPINLKTVAQNAVDRVMETAHKAGLTLDLTASEDMIFVNGEEGYLMKAVSNLIDNAVAFTASGGRVKVTLGVTDERVDLAVSDTGIGIAPAEHQRIFERLYKVDKARTIDSGGLGMGLAITKRIMELHSGLVSVSSTPGEGSTFTLTFARAKQAAPRHRGAIASPITEDVKM